jgi:hypothetical protein
MTISLERLAIFAADVGSARKGNFGWAYKWRDDEDDGDSIEELADAIVRVDRNGGYVSLGFECPLFIPCPVKEADLGKQREGESGRPWSAGAGANAAVLGIEQLCWLLTHVRTRLDGTPLGTLDWAEFQSGRYKLFLWEAFVTGEAKSASHTEDALKAVRAFDSALPDPSKANRVSCASAISLAGLALLWTGWSEDSTILHKPTLVLKP